MTTYMTSRAFNQDTAAAKRAADREPVVITDRGRPAHVLINYGDYQRLVGAPQHSIVDLIAMEEDLAFEPAVFQPAIRSAEFE